MTSYASLKPALDLEAEIELPKAIGVLATGATKVYINLKNISITTLPGFTPAFHINTLTAGGDWATADPSGAFSRLDVRAIVQTNDNELINIEYLGIITNTPEIQKVLSGAADAKTTRWGDLVITPRFEVSASGKYKDLAGKVWVGSGRFCVEECEEAEGGRKTLVEYRISEVVGEQE